MVDIATTPCNEVTVVLLGQGEIGHRARAQYYYQQAGIPCLSLEPLQASSAGEVCRQRLEQVLQQVATPFVALALDADFVLASALQRAAACLHEQPDAIAAQGYALGYVAGNAEVMYYKLGASLPERDEDGARARLHQYGLAGRQAWRAVVRVPALQAALAAMPIGSDFAAFRLGVSYAVLAQGLVVEVEQTDVVCAREAAVNAVLQGEQLNEALRNVREWDSEHLKLCSSEAGFAVLNRFVRDTYGQGDAPLLFTSTWVSVSDEPERRFEPRQYIEMPYYNKALFGQLTALEFLCHAWPAGHAQYQALEGCWVRQRDLLRVHPNDTADSLQLRHWEALALGLFDPQVCRELVGALTGPDDAARAKELADWLERLEQIPGIEQQQRLHATPSGYVLAALEAATPDSAAIQQVNAHLDKRPAGQIAFVVLDLGNDDKALQATFDSLLASGIRNFKLVVLKGGQPPAITTARDILHFIQVNDGNWLAHLNQVVRQLPCEWLMLLQAGDELCKGGLQHLLVELAESPACQAICANEVQRDEQGRLHAVVRPGADLNLLRSQPDLMSRHWVIRRQAVLDLGGYSETHRQALELDLLLRLAETQGLGCLAHLDDYLVVGECASKALIEQATAVVNRHLTQLGYRAQLREQQDAGLVIDFRHAATPLVSILIASDGDSDQLEACLTSVIQRTRYPRYEVLVACADEEMTALVRFGGRVRLLSADSRTPLNTKLNLAASQARGEYLVLLSARCQVTTPAWIEALLNEAQRPEVGVTGALLRAADGTLAHAGYVLQENAKVISPWQGLSPEECAQIRWPQAVRSCAAVSGDCLMVRRDVFEHSDCLPPQPGGDIDLCVRIGQAGMLVLWTPFAQLLDSAAASVPIMQERRLQVAAGLSISDDISRGNALGWLEGI
ncbi:glycosyltransferase [Pseudomonas putida]|uniref:glycosyltransferase n=1 Tax=Pseudomonas TaxID=286 RepID=UPI003466F3C0